MGRNQKNRLKWKTIFQEMGPPAMILDLHHNIVASNRSNRKLTGLTESGLKRHKCYEIFHGMAYPPDNCPMQYLLKSREPKPVEMQMEAFRSFFLVTCTPMLDSRNRVERVIHISSDITERKKMESAILDAEGALEQSKKRLSLAAEIADVGMWDWRLDIRRLFPNKKFLEITGLEEKETRRFSLHYWLSRVHPEDRKRVLGNFKAHFNEETDRVENRLRIHHPRKGYVWLYGVSKVIDRNRTGRPTRMAGAHRDITRRQIEKLEREKLIEKLEKTLSRIKRLGGLLPICSACKKIRDDKGYWNQIEAYIKEHSEAEFSHGICPECAKRLYPDYDIYDDQ